MNINLKGYITVDRSIQIHWLFDDDHKFKRWLELVMMANWSRGFARNGNHRALLERGQAIISVRFLMHRWKTNGRYVIDFISELEKEKMIECKRKKAYTIISIKDYDQYQRNEPVQSQDNHSQENEDLEHVGKHPEQRNRSRLEEEKEIKNNTLSNNTREEENFGVVESKMNFTLSDYCEELKHSDASIEQAMMALRRDKECVLRLIDLFLPEMQFQTKVHADFNDFKKHFINWAKIQLQNEKRNGNGGQKQQGNNPDNQLKRRRGTDVGNHKASDYGGPFSLQPDSTEGV